MEFKESKSSKVKSNAKSPRSLKSPRQVIDVSVHTEEEIVIRSPKSPKSPKSPTGESGDTMKSARLGDSEVKFFNSISNFVDDISTYLSEINQRIPNVFKYNELLKHTRLVHKKNIRKHIAAFTAFITANQKCIEEKKIDVFEHPLIFFSENVNINMNDVMHKCDDTSKKVILEHLLNFRYLIAPSDDIKSALMSLMTSTAVTASANEVATAESNSNDNPLKGLDGIFNIISQNIDKNDPNPMNSVMKLIASPVFGDIVSEVQKTAQNGGLNEILAKLMS